MESRKNYGWFDDTRGEYVITDYDTPRPWMNYLGNEDFFSLVSNTGGGYSFYKDAKHRRLTTCCGGSFTEANDGRCFYIKDDDVLWSPFFRPCKTPLDSYECRHGVGYTRIKASKDDVDISALFFVPLETNAEIQKLTFTNNTGSVKRLQIFSMQQWCNWEADLEEADFYSEVEVDGPIIFNKAGYRAQRDYYAFYSVNNAHIEGFDTDREEFLGEDNDLCRPQAVRNGASFGSIAKASSSIASHSIDLRLWPGETKDLIFMLGYIENKPKDKFEKDGSLNKDKAWKMVSKFDSSSKVDKAFAELKEYWHSNLESFTLKSPDEKTDRMVNVWNQYQSAVNFNFPAAPSSSILGCIHQRPELAERRILDLAATQAEDGALEGNPMWLVYCTSAYIKEIGEFSILKEKVPFASGAVMPLADHLRLALEYVLKNRGSHGLPLYGDSESVAAAAMFVVCAREFAQLCSRSKREEFSATIIAEAHNLSAIISSQAWDGEWFVNSFDPSGKAVGSKRNEEGKIYLEPQAWCSLAEIGKEKGMTLKALDSVRNYMDCEQGIVFANPAFARFDQQAGSISSYPQGFGYNGGVSCPTNPLIVIAEALSGRCADAWEHYRKITPSYIHNQRVYRLEPFVYCDLVSGRDATRPGEASKSWITPTSSLAWYAVSQYLLGIRPSYDGLEVDPCIPMEWEGFEVERKFRKAQYHISVKNPDGLATGVKQLIVDGKPVEGKIIPYSSGKHTVEVIIG